MTRYHRPSWASFDDEDYKDPPDDWAMTDYQHEMTEFNDDPNDMAPVIAAHRYEIVHLWDMIEEKNTKIVDMEEASSEEVDRLKGLCHKHIDTIEGVRLITGCPPGDEVLIYLNAHWKHMRKTINDQDKEIRDLRASHGKILCAIRGHYYAPSGGTWALYTGPRSRGTS